MSALVVGCGNSDNHVPVASATCGAGSNCKVLPNGEATLDARASDDADGDDLAYRWYAVDNPNLCPSIVDCPCGWSASPFTGFIRDTGSPMTTFHAPVTDGQQLVFQVEVSDAQATARACSIYFVESF
jgi:hypothetical protein